MNIWIFEAIGGYFFAGTSRVVDKILLTRAIPEPLVFTFYAGLLSAFSLFLVPFGVVAIPAALFAVTLGAGISFLAGLYFFYRALVAYDISRVVPLVISMGPFLTLIFSLYFLGGHSDPAGNAGIFFLIIGGVLLSWEKKHTHKFRGTLLAYAFAASFCTSISLVLTNEILHTTNFISGFVWTRVGIVCASLSLIALPSARRRIFEARAVRPRHIALFIGNKWIGGLAYFFINHAIYQSARGSISFVHALGSFEYLFVFILSAIFTITAPSVLKEDFSVHAISVKLLGTGSLTAALYILLRTTAFIL